MKRQRKDYTRELVQLRTGREVDELLRELYVDKRHGQEAIADALGVSRAVVERWLSQAGISRDDRGPVELPA